MEALAAYKESVGIEFLLDSFKYLFGWRMCFSCEKSSLNFLEPARRESEKKIPQKNETYLHLNLSFHEICLIWNLSQLL